jgi:multisubunit Na+/H+ antiporter MnhE subunit
VHVGPLIFDSRTHHQKEENMLETIAVILLVLWLLGLVTSYTMGGLIHGLLVIAIVVILIRVIQGRRI